MLSVQLTTATNDSAWGKDALISYADEAVLIHLQGEYLLRRIQQAARQLQSQGALNVRLEGAGWSYERQWAFYCGFVNTKKPIELQWASVDEDEIELLNARRHSVEWLRRVVNTPAEDLYPERLADEAVSFLTNIAGEHISITRCVGDDLLTQGWVGIHNVALVY